jgi:N-acetylmuramoyl-L-alanine amidase
MKLFFKILFLFNATFCFPQQSGMIRIQHENKTRDIPVHMREETVYVPVKEFAEGLGIRYEGVPDERIILKGNLYDLLVTAKNPFFIVNDKTGKRVKVFQVPTSTYLISNNIYIPLSYSLNILKEIIDNKIVYDEPKKLLASVSSIEPEREIPEIKIPPPVNMSYDIQSISIEEKANGTLVRISPTKQVRFYNSSFDNGLLTVVLRGVNTDPSITDRLVLTGLVKNVQIQNKGEDSELLFILSSDFSAGELLKIDGSNDLLLTLHNKVFAGREQNKLKEKWDFDVIVLDAGHGGKDPGAIGVNGAKEKDINLAITLALGKLIEERLHGVRVEYTRKDDSFIELYKRGKIANDRNGKLFISVHCNSTANKKSNASGFEVYLLRPGRTQEAIAIAEIENSVIKFEDDPHRYQKLTDENFILVSMAHSAYMKYSEKFSEYLDKHFSNGFGLPNRGVKQAGLYVLVGASMPGVLIEAGFLSNKNDAAYLNSKKGQEKTAELIFESIKSFKSYYESFLGLEN